MNLVVGDSGYVEMKLAPASHDAANCGSIGMRPKNLIPNSCASCSPPPLVLGNNSVACWIKHLVLQQ